jgi:pimeloyl-ACP methyl ester carboxylesterase
VTADAGQLPPAARRLPHVSAARQRQLQRLFSLLQRLGPGIAAGAALALYQVPTRRQLDAEDAATLARARTRFIDSPVGRLRLLEWGAGPDAVLLVHGWGSHAPRWTTFVEAIVAQGWRALAVDMPGHGQSAGRRSNLLRFCTGLRAALDQAGPFKGIVAHSLGALATAAVLAEHAATPPPGAAVLVSLPQDLDYLLGSFEDLLGLAPATRARLRRRFAVRFGRAPAAFGAAGWLAQAPCPVLRVHDADDDIVPVGESLALDGLPGTGPCWRTQGLGHSGLLRDPALAARVMRFLAAPATGSAPPPPR